MGPRAVLDVVVKRKIPSPLRESNPRTPIVHPVAQRRISIKVVVIWIVTPCSGVVPRTWRQHVPQKCWYPAASLYGVKALKKINFHRRENLESHIRSWIT
jgi:hypothetical protein